MSGSNLPPGVTQRMIDDYFAGPCVDCEVGQHDMCSDDECRCTECDERARADYYESLAEERRERMKWRDEEG